MSTKPISRERLEAFRRLDLTALMPQSEKWAQATRLQAGRWIQQMKPALVELLEEIAAQRESTAVLEKTVDGYEAALGLADGESLTAWRAEHDGIPLGTYLAVEEAMAHCEHASAMTPHQAAWYEDDPDDSEEPTTLQLYVDYDDEQSDTGYAVVPVPLLPAYDPGAER